MVARKYGRCGRIEQASPKNLSCPKTGFFVPFHLAGTPLIEPVLRVYPMNGIRKISGIILLLFVGCLSTAPVAQRLEESDPFRFPPVLNLPAPLPGGLRPPLLDSPEPETADVVDEMPEDDEFIFEPEETPPMSLDDQAALLSQNQWSKNLARINMLDSERKSKLTPQTLEDLQRRKQMNLLNMSEQERIKWQSQQFDYVDGSAVDWRWMHRGVDQLHALPKEQRKSIEVFLRDKKYSNQKILQANTAILLGRDGNPKVGKSFLLPLAKDEKTHAFIRCAAVEVLGRMSSITADDLISLLDNVKDREIETTDKKTGEPIRQRQPGNVDVWSELLMAIAEKIEPWEHTCFIEPFYSSNGEIRLTTAKIWRKNSSQQQPKGALPEKFLEIAKREHNPLVRVEIIKTLGAWKTPDLFTLLENDLKHPTADVRNAAMLTLADARCQEAIPVVKDQFRAGGANRVAAVSALRKLGAFDEVFKCVDDQDAQVRIEVAKTFSERCSPQTAKFAETYVSDRNAKVQLATIEAVNSWSIEESGRVLLLAAKSFHSDVRSRAVEMLAEHGVDYPGFDPEDRPENQTARYQELVEIFCEEIGVDPRLDLTGKEHPAANKSTIQQVSALVPEDATLTEVRRCLDDWSDVQQRPLIQRRLVAHGSRLMPSIDHLLTVEKRTIPESLDRVFAEVEPMFREIEKLRSDDLSTRRRAAAELKQLGVMDRPSKLAAKRIVDLTAKQEDAFVLTSLLSALQNADPELVCQLARPLMQSESAQVRRVSCEMLRQFGSSEDVELLQDALRDPSRSVVRGALQAMDALLEEEDADSPVFVTLKTMLSQSDPELQTAIAAIVHRLGHQEGTDTFRRLAMSSDHRHRIDVARTVSELNDPMFIPMLIRFLDDGNGTVRSEALKGLPKLADRDIGRGEPTQQQIDRWKAWAKERRE